jgi:hypothetical protein
LLLKNRLESLKGKSQNLLLIQRLMSRRVKINLPCATFS